MKKYFSILIFFIFYNSPVFSQYIWNIWYQYGPFGGNVSDITISSFHQLAIIANNSGSVKVYDWVDLLKNEEVSAMEYAAIGNRLYIVTNDSLKRTDDNGYHWADVLAPGISVKGLSISPLLTGNIFLWSDSVIVFGKDENYPWEKMYFHGNKINEVYPSVTSDSLFFIASENGLFLSGLNGFVDTLLYVSVNSICCADNMFNRLYVSNKNRNTIYFSNDDGATWDSSSVGLPEAPVNDLVVYNTNPQIAFAATIDGVYKTVNGGAVWFKYSNNLSYPDSGIIKILRSTTLAIDGEKIFTGTQEGIFRSTITNDSWEHLGANNQSVKSIAKKSVYWDDNLFIGTSKGVQKSDAFEWTTSDLYSQFGPEIYKIYCNRHIGDSLVIAVEMKENGGSLFYRSMDNGKTFKPVFFTPEGTGKINAFYTREDSTNIIFALTDNDSNSYGMFVSFAYGDSGTWMPVLSTFDKKFNAFTFNPYIDTLCFIVNNNELYKSTDGGWTLKYISTIPSKKINDLLIAEYNYMFAAGNGVKLSTDYGYTWSDWGLDSIEVFKVVYDWWSLIAASHTEGVFANYHLRGDWIDFNIGLPSKKVNDMVNFTHGYLHLATENNSVYMMYLIINAVKTDEMSVNDFKLEQNYPNPFNPATKIKFTIPSSVNSQSLSPSGSNVSLKVFDMLGRELATLVNEELTPGSYEIDFEAKGFASGVYFYRLEAGSFTSTKKMILLR